MSAISVLAHIASDLRLDDRPLKPRQNSLPLFKTEPDLGKLVDAFVETENGLVAHRDSLIVNLPKMNGEMHEQYLPERLGPNIAEHISSETKLTSINTNQKRLPIKWHAPLDEAPWFAMRDPGTNPCIRISVHLGERRTRHLSLDELQRLGNALKEASEEGESPYFIGAVLLFLLTGARLREILNAERNMVDRNNGVLELRDRKAGDPVIYLSPQALAVIDALPEVPNNPYLIPGRRPGRPMINPYKPWKRLMASAGIDNATFHDLRRTYASHGLGSGLTLEQIGALLGHSQAQTTQGYAFLESQIARENAERIGAGIHQLLNATSDATGDS